MRRNFLRRQHARVLTGLSLVAVIAVAGFGLAVRANAQTSFSVESIGGQLGLGDADLRQVVINVIRWVLGILTLTGVVYMMYGGYLWLTAAGNEKRVEKAKQVILQAAIGMVIVLLAWAIVFFVARSIANVTNQSGGGGGSPDFCDVLAGEVCDPVTAFDITNIASCSVGNPNDNVPRSSAIQLTFNAKLKDGAVQQAVAEDVTNGNPPNLIVQECASNDCSNPANLSTPVPLENQKYKTGTQPTTTGTPPQADWIQNGKVVTFYHVANDTLAADARLFKPNQKYLLTVPAKDASKALIDAKDRKLQNCRRSASDITGLAGCDATENDRITWEFTTGDDVDGPALSVASAYPSFAYQTTTASPNRSVARSSFLSIQYNTPIDFNTLTTNTFRVFKCSAANTPTAANDWNDCDDETGNQVPASNFEIQPRPDGRGGILRIVDPVGGAEPFMYEAFTWYKVEVKDVRSLCGRVQDPSPKTWVFQTNDRVPGVRKVYPRDGFQNACPATKVFIQYNTSMWDGETDDCNVGGGSYVSRGLLTSNPGRNLISSSAYDPDDPETCTMYEFASTTTLLPPNRNFEARVESDLVIDSNGRKLNYGYNVAGSTSEGPWAFKTATAATCAQEPVITRIAPGQGPDGQCLSVIGDYFEKVNYPDVNADAPDAGDKLELRATNQPADTWTNRYIVSTVDAGTLTKNVSHPYTVTVNYPAPIGPLTSSPENFYLTDDPASQQGPCLLKISPSRGPINTKVTATGKRLGTSGEVRYSTKSPPQWTVGGPWTETRIDNINVDNGSPRGSGLVTIWPSTGTSNPLPFEVTERTTTPGTAPAIEETTVCSSTRSPSPNPKRDQTDACINAWPSARFTVEIDPSTVNNSNVLLEECDAAFTACGAPIVSYSSVALPGNRVVQIRPAGRLTPAKAYRVTINNVLSADGVAMAAPYQWRFTTKAGATECPIDRVIIQQTDRTFNKYFKLGLPTTVMDSACNEVDGTGLTYAWSNTDPSICALRPGHTGPSNICESDNPLVNEGETVVRTRIASEGIDSNEVRITASLIACDTSADCVCGSNRTSQCVGGSCTPVVTSMTPDDGRVGTWTTIQGCWFGKYVDTKSKVIFTDNKEGLIPSTTGNSCTAANTWTNTQIVREVPKLETPTNDTTNDAITGPVRVIRGDSVTATTPTPFTISAEERPKICRINPSSRFPAEAITIYGKDLGTDQGVGDKVELTDADTSTVSLFPSPLAQWDADRIGGLAPSPIPLPAPANVYGVGSVRVTHLGKLSNPLEMTLRDPAGATGSEVCAPADLCVYGDPVSDAACGIGRGCGFNHCCTTRPTVTATRPVLNETDICRNTQVQIDFSERLLPSSVTANTVRYFNGPIVTNGKISLLNGGRTIAYEPGLLSPLMDQRMSLAPVASTPVTVVNPSFEAGVPGGWTAPTNMQASNDVASGNGSTSALADCTGSGCSQASIVQDVEPPSAVIRGYRVTAWIKADVPVGSRGGFITQCTGPGSCGQNDRKITFDRWQDAPGVVDNRAGTSRVTFGWKKIDFVVVNPQGRNIGLRLNCFADRGAKIWCDNITVTRITEQKTELLGASGVAVDTRYNQQPGTDPFNLTFTSSAAICTLDRVTVTAPNKLLNAANQVLSPDPLAQAFSGRRSAPLSEVPGVYEWEWRWERSGGSDAVATVQNQDAATTTVRSGTTPGKISAKATATVTQDANNRETVGRQASGQTEINVDFCETPWLVGGNPGFTDSVGNCTSGGACPSFHFKLYYCVRPGEPQFNHRAIEGQNAADSTRKKSFFFKETATSQDVIGMLIYENSELLSPYDWFTARFPGVTPGSSTKIGGFPAVRTGTTAYVGVTDLTATGQLQGYMFVIDFNSNIAESTTQAIYNRMLQSIEFNVHIADEEDRTSIISDTQRVQDLRSIKTLLEKYKAVNNRYPDLPAGSFLPGVSTSAWPSWQRELANALTRTLPSDPVNGFTPGVCQAPYEAASCWAESLKRFQCPAGSQIYAYKAISSGAGYELFANLRYTGVGGFNNFSGNPCSSVGTGNTCACFNYRLSTP